MNIWHDIDEERIYPTDFMAVVEISMGSNMKYELDKKTGMLSLDRVLLRTDPAYDIGAQLSHRCHDHGGRRYGRREDHCHSLRRSHLYELYRCQ